MDALITKYSLNAGFRKFMFDGITIPGAANTLVDRHIFIYRKRKSDCYICKGKMIRGVITKRKVFSEILGNGPARLAISAIRKITRYGCSICDIFICNFNIY